MTRCPAVGRFLCPKGSDTRGQVTTCHCACFCWPCIGVVIRGPAQATGTELEAVRPSPYHAGLAGATHRTRLPVFPALSTCYGPLWLSPLGKSTDLKVYSFRYLPSFQLESSLPFSRRTQVSQLDQLVEFQSNDEVLPDLQVWALLLYKARGFLVKFLERTWREQGLCFLDLLAFLL
jgi:hypothetical protein